MILVFIIMLIFWCVLSIVEKKKKKSSIIVIKIMYVWIVYGYELFEDFLILDLVIDFSVLSKFFI